MMKPYSGAVCAGTLLEYETLELRIHPPNVVIEDASYEDTTVVTIDSANRPGTLIEVRRAAGGRHPAVWCCACMEGCAGQGNAQPSSSGSPRMDAARQCSVTMLNAGLRARVHALGCNRQRLALCGVRACRWCSA